MISPTELSWAPAYLVAVGSKVYFDGKDDAGGNELWVTAGTTTTTKRVAEMQAGADGSTPEGLFASGGKLYFDATSAAYGTEVWVYKY